MIPFDYKNLIAVDEVGRGSLIDSVFVCAGFFNVEKLPKGVKDSKLLSKNAIEDLYYQIINEESHIISIKTATIEEIEKYNILHSTLNAMQKAADEVYFLLQKKADLSKKELNDFNLVDLKNIKKDQNEINKNINNLLSNTLKVKNNNTDNKDNIFSLNVSSKIDNKVICLIDGNQKFYSNLYNTFCCKKADLKYIQVAAASIVAKFTRDNYILNNLHPLHPNYMWSKNAGYASQDHINAIKKYGITNYHRKSFCKNFYQYLPSNQIQENLF